MKIDFDVLMPIIKQQMPEEGRSCIYDNEAQSILVSHRYMMDLQRNNHAEETIDDHETIGYHGELLAIIRGIMKAGRCSSPIKAATTLRAIQTRYGQVLGLVNSGEENWALARAFSCDSLAVTIYSYEREYFIPRNTATSTGGCTFIFCTFSAHKQYLVGGNIHWTRDEKVIFPYAAIEKTIHVACDLYLVQMQAMLILDQKLAQIERPASPSNKM